MFQCLLLFALSQTAAEDLLDYKTPTGWRREVIALPPGFAPKMKWQGKESARFAPGMFRAGDKSFFSYVILMHVKRPVAKLTAEEITRELLTYYRGLAKAVGGRELPNLDPSKFRLRMKKQQVPKAASDKTYTFAYTAELEWTEPFVTKKPQKLKLEVHGWESAKQQSFVFVSASPSKMDSSTWKQLREIRQAARKR